MVVQGPFLYSHSSNEYSSGCVTTQLYTIYHIHERNEYPDSQFISYYSTADTQGCHDPNEVIDVPYVK